MKNSFRSRVIILFFILFQILLNFWHAHNCCFFCFIAPIGEITLLVPLHQFTCHFGESCNHARTHGVVMFPHLKRFFFSFLVDVLLLIFFFPRFCCCSYTATLKIYIFFIAAFLGGGRKKRIGIGKLTVGFPPLVSCCNGRWPYFRCFG